MLYFAVTNSEAFFSHYFYGSTQQDFSFMLEHPWNTVAQKSSLTMVTQRRLLDITGCVTFLHLPSALWWPVPLLLHHLHSGLVSHIATYLSIGFKRERERERERHWLEWMCAGCSVGDDVFRNGGFVTETHAGMCRGVVRPRTRGWWEEDDLQEKPGKNN